MIDIARLQIQINSDGVRIAGQRLDNLARKGTQVGRTLTTRLTLPLVAGMGAAVREAALLEGAMDKFNVVFRGMNDEMERFIDDFNREFPIARRNAVQAAAAMQDLLVPMGIAREEAAGMTKDWLELAGALSAFNDVPMEQALEAIRSGIAGMSRPLRQFGIDARETVLQQTALEEGLLRAGEAMNEQVRQQALLIQATKQSTDAIEGLEEQKGSLLWQIEELKRDSQDLLAVWGQDLIPVTRDLIGMVRGLTGMLMSLDEDTRRTIITAGIFAAALPPIIWALSSMTTAVIKTSKAVRVLTSAMIANPYLAVGAAILGIGTHAAFTQRNIQALNREIESIFGGGAESIDQVNQAIIQMEDRIRRSETALSGMGIDPQGTQAIQDMQAELTRLVAIRDQMAADQLDGIISSREVEESAEAVDELVRSIEGIRPAVENIPPIDNIVDPIQQAEIRKLRDEYQEFQSVLDDLLNLSDIDFSHRLDLPEVEKEVEEVSRAARDLGFTFSSAFEDAIVSGNSFRDVLDGIFQDLLRIATRSLITEPLGNALSAALGGVDFFGGVENVNDALITSRGDIVKFHKDDNILAMKDFSPVVNGGNAKVNVHVTTINESSNAQVHTEKRQRPNGDFELVQIIRDVNKELHNSGQMDRTMSSNYGINRKGRRVG